MQTDEPMVYLSREDVAAAGVTMTEIIAALERAFEEKAAGRVEMPPKPGLHPGGGDAFIHAMPAYIPGLGSAGVKWVSGFPENTSKGLPYISGLIILNDTATGLPIAIMDADWITGMRTAAASALSARHLARLDAGVLGVLGCGVQGGTHVEALRCVLPGLTTLRAYDVDHERAQRFVSRMAEAHGLDARAVDDPRDAVEAADVVVTAGPILRVPHATIQAGWMVAGAFATAVDFDSYWSAGAFAELDLFSTDDVPQLEHFRELGYFRSIPPVDAELAELVAGLKSGRTSPHQRTMACNLGLALDDMAVAPLVLERARSSGRGIALTR
jgi:ornithine cyclodeaminase/alanine dehydrogenase